jgi:hypothetical protein
MREIGHIAGPFGFLIRLPLHFQLLALSPTQRRKAGRTLITLNGMIPAAVGGAIASDQTTREFRSPTSPSSQITWQPRSSSFMTIHLAPPANQQAARPLERARSEPV